MSRWLSFCSFAVFMVLATGPVLAQLPAGFTSTAPTAAEQGGGNTTTQTTTTTTTGGGGKTLGAYTINEIEPRKVTSLPLSDDIIKSGEEVLQQMMETVEANANRTAEEEIYKQRGIALDFLNKPVDLFKLTCAVDGDGKEKAKIRLGETFTFAIDQWKSFCASAAKGSGSVGQKIKGAAKCAAESLLKGAFSQAQQKLKEFKEQSFCRAFTDFINDQVSQCITVRFDVPRGQFPGFPAMNQCMFGRLGLTVGKKTSVDGYVVSGSNTTLKDAAGKPLSDVVSAHSFEYSPVLGRSSTSGYGGAESQLLGNDGIAGIISEKRWRGTATAAVAGSTCGKLDPDLVASFTAYPNRGDGKPENSGTYMNPLDNRINGWRPDETKPGGADWQTIAVWAESADVNPLTKKKYIELTPGSLGTWSQKTGYTYLANCYGFEMYPMAALCNTPGNSPEWTEQHCTEFESEDICCDPDNTNCLAAKIIHETTKCKDDKVQIDPNTGKVIVDKDGNPTCTLAIEREAGKAKICADTCCNPAKNDCAEIEVDVCPKYLGVSQCVPASPSELAEFDPVYSKIRAKPNRLLGGKKLCCVTEWCNLCPQDLTGAAKDLQPGSTVFMKKEDTANVPDYCLAKPRTRGATKNNPNGDNPMNELGKNYQLKVVSQKEYDDTQFACNLLNQPPEDETWDKGKIYETFIKCPKKQKNKKVSEGLLDPLNLDMVGFDKLLAKWFTGSSNCPEGTEAKAILNEFFGPGDICPNMADLTLYPKPIDKVMRVEGEDRIQICSELELCPANIPPEENVFNPESLVRSKQEALKKALDPLGMDKTGLFDKVIEKMIPTQQQPTPTVTTPAPQPTVQPSGKETLTTPQAPRRDAFGSEGANPDKVIEKLF